MSGQTPGKPPAAEPTMDEILASIRQIISEGDRSAEPQAAAPAVRSEPPPPASPSSLRAPSPPPPEDEDDGPLLLDRGMLVLDDDEAVGEPSFTPPQDRRANNAAPPAAVEDTMPPPPSPPVPRPIAASGQEAPSPEDNMTDEDVDVGLIAPQVADTAASSFHQLARAVVQERHVAVQRGGVTLEEMVREELRPLLKSWLEAHLPATVERLVKAEIERVVGRLRG